MKETCNIHTHRRIYHRGTETQRKKFPFLSSSVSLCLCGKFFIFVFILFFSTAFATSSLRERLLQGQAGDYIVTEQNKNISLLLIRSLSPSSVIFEEIIAPEHEIPTPKTSWKEWVRARAPGHTSWIAYEIDLTSNALKESYSFTKRGWLFIDEQEYFLAKLLCLPLSLTPQDERRRIGPAPAQGEKDQRALWIPPLVLEGAKQKHPHIEAFKTRWLKDQSELSECEIELYFDVDQPRFPFPYWMEIKGEHYTLKIRTIDSGSGMQSPVNMMPYRIPQFLNLAKKTQDKLLIPLASPTYYTSFSLYAIDLSDPVRKTLAIPHTLRTTQKKEELVLEVSTKELSSLLEKGHRYKWAITPSGTPSHYIESEETFICPTEL